MQVYSLFDLARHLRQVVALNFAESLWVTAEIAQAKLSRGHLYLELVQKGETDIVAQNQAVIWARDLQRLRRQLGPALDEVLREGVEVKMRVRIDYHERFGLKLLPEEIDTAYTFGQLELQRRQTIQTLHAEGLLERNRALPLPLALQRLAVVSSEGAAGLQDFREHLASNIFGYQFDIQLFTAAVQGANVLPEVSAAFRAIQKKSDHFDCVIVLRGGGARLDLAAFDALDLCRQAAQLPLPLFSGIGHETDQTVLDLVAYEALKTPTAVADFIIQHNLFFENNLVRMAAQLHSAGEYRLGAHQMELDRAATDLRWNGKTFLQHTHYQLDHIGQTLPLLARNLLQRQLQHLNEAESLCAALHPDAVLQRGFSLTLHQGRVVTAAAQLQPGDQIVTKFKEGTSSSIVMSDE